MAIAIFFALLPGLLIFIIWDRRRPIAPPSREAMKSGWPKSEISKWPVFAGFSLISAALGMVEWFNPSHPPFTGRWLLVRAALYDAIGSRGFAYLLAALAVGLAIAAAFQWRSEISFRKGARAVAR
jgi:hypothetical protein